MRSAKSEEGRMWVFWCGDGVCGRKSGGVGVGCMILGWYVGRIFGGTMQRGWWLCIGGLGGRVVEVFVLGLRHTSLTSMTNGRGHEGNVNDTDVEDGSP
jgi:hypothetical protein